MQIPKIPKNYFLLAGICQEISQIETEMQMKRRPALLKGNFMSEAS